MRLSTPQKREDETSSYQSVSETLVTKKPRALERRDILTGFAAAGALASFGAWGLGSSLSSEHADKTDAERRASLIDHLIASDAEAALHIAAAPLAAGLPPERVLDAAFLMPMWTNGDMSDIHAMAAVPAVMRLVTGDGATDGATDGDAKRLMPVMWAVSEAHAWSGKARAAAPPQNDDLAEVTEACSAPRNDPHVAIWAAQAGRMVERMPEHRAMIAGSVAAYADAHEQPLHVTTSSTSEPFTALAMMCIDARLTDRTETGLGVHLTTLLDALWRLDSPHATAWVTELSDRHRPRLDVPASQLGETAGDPFALAPSDPIAAYRAALGAVARDERQFRREVRRRVVERGHTAHDFKYWDAAESIADRLDGDARTRWVASMVGARVLRSEARWSQYDLVEELLSG